MDFIVWLKIIVIRLDKPDFFCAIPAHGICQKYYRCKHQGK